VTLARAGVERRAHVGYWLVDAGRVDARASDRGAVGRPGRAHCGDALDEARRLRLAIYVAAIVGLNAGARPGDWRGALAFARGARRPGRWSGRRGPARGRDQPIGGGDRALGGDLPDAAERSCRASTSRPASPPNHRTRGRGADAALPSSPRSTACSRRSRSATWPTAIRTSPSPCSATCATRPREHMDGDDALLARARDGVQALNARYRAAGRPAPFYLLPPRPPLEPARGRVDGLGAQARQARAIQRGAARGARALLHHRRRRPAACATSST
jgi:hypothetical protein